MCILLLTTHHPTYPLLILSNRDEFLHRPTARAHWWTPSTPLPTPSTATLSPVFSPPESSTFSTPTLTTTTGSSPPAIFSGLDLARPERGTWLGVSSTGRLAVLTNFSEKTRIMGTKSRGGLVRRYLESGESLEEFVRGIQEDWEDVGGFSLLVGSLRGGRLCVVSNRGREGWVERDEEDVEGKEGRRERTTVGLSNSHLTEPWSKVLKGRQRLEATVQTAAAESWPEEKLTEALFSILCIDDLPEDMESLDHDGQMEALKESIYIRPFETSLPTPKQKRDNKRQRRMSVPDNAMAAADGGALAVAHGDMDIEDGEEEEDEPPEIFPGMEKSRLYGTQKQTVILVRKDGLVKYIERTLFDDDAKPVKGEDRDVVAEFMVEGWGG